MKIKTSKILLFLAILALIFLFRHFHLQEFLTLDFLKENQNAFQEYYRKNTVFTITLYLAVYIISTALSLPGAAILTLAGGALFGFITGTILVSIASTIGATLAFLVARVIFKDLIQEKFGDKLEAINNGIKKEGAFYLFTLRLIPVFPFFLINAAMGLTPIKTIVYFLVSMIGMLPGTMVYVNAGVQLSKVESLQGILSPGLLASFALLGIFPLLTNRLVGAYKTGQIYKRYRRPGKYDYNMVVIGAGSAGLVTSYIGSTVKAKVALIEKNKMGGDCLNTGCVPSKALLKSAKMVHNAKRAREFGIDNISVDFNFSDVMERVQKVIKKIEPHDSMERYKSLGVECIQGTPKIKSPWEVEVNGKTLRTKNITIATGASPLVPPIKGVEDMDILVSDNLWEIRELPKKFLVLGGGSIGVEMSQAFSRLGSQVTIVEMLDRILSIEDPDTSEQIHQQLASEGVEILTGHKAVEFKRESNKKILVCESKHGTKEVEFDEVLVAVGRRANTKGFGLEELEIDIRPNGTIEVNEYLQTKYPNIFACGDVTGPFQLTHTASHQAWFCAVNGLFGSFRKFKVDYSVIPWCTYTDPEIATVGLNETLAGKKDIAYEVTKYEVDDLDRAIADSEEKGFVKVLTVPGKDKILGATIVGNHAAEMILEFICAMKHGFGLNKILGTIHPYPTMGEANKFLAGNWKKARKPEKLLNYIEKYHTFRRG